MCYITRRALQVGLREGKGRTDSIIPPTITSQPNWFFRTKNDLSSYVETRKPQAALKLGSKATVETRKPQASEK